MKNPTARPVTAWIFLSAIAMGTVAIIWMLMANSTPPANALLIEKADAGLLGKSNPTARPPVTSSNAQPSATQRTIKLEGDGSVDLPGSAPQSIMAAASPTPVYIAVYITGAVAQPGVYFLTEGARVQDAIAAAGGALIAADLDSINLAQKLVDEAQITIGRRDDGTRSSVQQPAISVQPLGSTGTSGQSLTQPAGPKPTPATQIDINTATQAQLESLPGVGPSLAARIVTDRETYGPFSSVEDLMRVSGIKDGILAKIRDYITVGN